MNTKSRITSILKANSLDETITGLQTFNLSELTLGPALNFQLPSNLRLGHLAERIVSQSIKSSINFKLLYENVQVIEGKQTIGEIDFIIEEINTKRIIHMELAYKFYLYDPILSPDQINNWIGPNRNDSLTEKLEKLKRKQFPLLYHNSAKSMFNNIDIKDASQELCLLVSLFIPYDYKSRLNPIFEKAVKGYYINFERFIKLDDSTKTYCIPTKKEWGMDPSENQNWTDFTGVEEYIKTSMKEQQAPLCWQKQEDSFLEFFIVWW
ncbi:MAG: hypothetical protein ACI81Y_002345 [Glaciecola sp.]|jgi:hypothetical protein